MLRVGDAATDVDLPDFGTEMVRLTDLRDKSEILNLTKELN
jgi:peroxiredoxin